MTNNKNKPATLADIQCVLDRITYLEGQCGTLPPVGDKSVQDRLSALETSAKASEPKECKHNFTLPIGDYRICTSCSQNLGLTNAAKVLEPKVPLHECICICRSILNKRTGYMDKIVTELVDNCPVHSS